MRAGLLVCAAVAIGALAAGASAQTRLRSAPLQTGLVTASLPPPSTTTGASSPQPDLFRAGPETYAPRFDRLLEPDPRFLPCCGVILGQVFVPPSWWLAPGTPIPASPAVEAGYLRLLVEPGSVRVYVDEAYRGTVEGLRGWVPMEPGVRHVALRAPGYEAATFDLRIAPGETRTYRASFGSTRPGDRPVAEPIDDPITPAAPQTFYVIPGCYAGDRPPAGALPAGCDPTNLRIIPPAPLAQN